MQVRIEGEPFLASIRLEEDLFPAGDVDASTGYKRRVIGRQERCKNTDFLSGTEPADRDTLGVLRD